MVVEYFGLVQRCAVPTILNYNHACAGKLIHVPLFVLHRGVVVIGGDEQGGHVQVA